MSARRICQCSAGASKRASAVERGAEPEPAVARRKNAAHVGIGEAGVLASPSGSTVAARRDGSNSAMPRFVATQSRPCPVPASAVTLHIGHRRARGAGFARARVFAGTAHAKIRMLRRRRRERVRDHVAEALERVRLRIVALEPVGIGAEPDAAAGILEDRVHVVRRRPHRVRPGSTTYWNTEPAGSMRASPRSLGADPEQTRAIDEKIRDQRAGQRAGQIALGTQPDFLAVLGIERDEPFVRHREPEPSARILGDRA